MEKTGVRAKCVTLLIDGPNDADPWGREALYLENGTKVGRLTSGGYSVVFNKSIGMGYVNLEYAKRDTELYIQIRNKKLKAHVVKLPFFKS